jgi:cytochrome c oxidase subunit 3
MAKDRDYLIHPQYIILILVLSGVSALFLGFTLAYLYNRIEQGVPPVELPTLFYWNSLLLLASSFTLIQAKRNYLEDQTQKYKWSLIITLSLSILFLIAQIFAWNQLMSKDILINSTNMASYLYIISGMHFVHVVAGIPFLAYFIFIAHKKMQSPVSVLIYFSDPDKKRRLNLLNIYWHFLDALWIYLVIFFLINYLIQ